MPQTFPEKIEAFNTWYKESFTDAKTGKLIAISWEGFERITTKAKELQLKLLREITSVDNKDGFILFDPKVKNSAYLFTPYSFYRPQMLSKEDQKTFDQTEKALSNLLQDHDLSKKDMDTISALRRNLQQKGIAISLVTPKTGDDYESYIALTMAGNARYMHSTLSKAPGQ